MLFLLLPLLYNLCVVFILHVRTIKINVKCIAVNNSVDTEKVKFKRNDVKKRQLSR
jgi:hypothetical protein